MKVFVKEFFIKQKNCLWNFLQISSNGKEIFDPHGLSVKSESLWYWLTIIRKKNYVVC